MVAYANGNDKGLDDPEFGHEYNQVQIGGQWYYCDLTWDADRIKKGEDLEHCLLSREDFQRKGMVRGVNCHIDEEIETAYDAPESYGREDISETIKNQDEEEKKEKELIL